MEKQLENYLLRSKSCASKTGLLIMKNVHMSDPEIDILLYSSL